MDGCVNDPKKYTTCIYFYTTGFPTWATGGPSAEVVGLPLGPGLRMDPYFVEDQPTSTNISVHAGQKAYLECRVRNLGAKRVRPLPHKRGRFYILLYNLYVSTKYFIQLTYYLSTYLLYLYVRHKKYQNSKH